MAFPKPADRRIARHFANFIKTMRYQRRLCAQPPSGLGSIRTGMATADDDNVKISMFHVKHFLFPQAKTGKDFIKEVFYINFANKGIQSCNRTVEFLCQNFRLRFSFAQ